MAEALQSDPTGEPARGITFRSVALGIGIVIFINLWVTYAETVVKTSRLNLSVFQITLLAVFIILIGVVNPLIKSVNRPLRLCPPPNLLSIVAIGIVGLRRTHIRHHRIFDRGHFHSLLFCHARKRMGRILPPQPQLVGRAHRSGSCTRLLRGLIARQRDTLARVAGPAGVVGQSGSSRICRFRHPDDYFAKTMGRIRKTRLPHRRRTH